MKRTAMALVATALLVAGCKEPKPVPPKLKTQVLAYIEKDYGYFLKLNFDEPWVADYDKLICGEFEAPPGLKEKKLRYLYYVDMKTGQVEKHSGWVTNSAVSQGIMDTNRRLFDGIWKDSCEPSGPRWYSSFGKRGTS